MIVRYGRRGLAAAVLSGGLLVGATAPALAEPPPNCTAADLAGVMSGVQAGTSAYLFTHPEVNDFFTSLKGKSREDMRGEIEGYLAVHPQVRDELKAVRQAAADFRNRCSSTVPDDPMG